MGSLGINAPALIVLGISIVIGLLMVLVFGYTSDQRAIHAAKDQLKANLLALRLFQDQIVVVVRSYARILLATGQYLRLAFKPLLLVVMPLTLLIVELDFYLGYTPIEAGQAFLIKASVSDPNTLVNVSLALPEGFETTAPAVHVVAENEVDWRVVATKAGTFTANVQINGQHWPKQVIVGSGFSRVSPVRLRDRFWERWFVSAEPALPQDSEITRVEVQYPAREIAFAELNWNWIWLFFVFSLVVGFVFKSVLGIEI